MVTQNVRQACAAMMPLNSTIWFQMRSGLGKMNSDTLNTEQMNCHKPITATSRIQGDQRSSSLVFMAPPFPSIAGEWRRCARAVRARCR